MTADEKRYQSELNKAFMTSMKEIVENSNIYGGIDNYLLGEETKNMNQTTGQIKYTEELVKLKWCYMTYKCIEMFDTTKWHKIGPDVVKFIKEYANNLKEKKAARLKALKS